MVNIGRASVFIEEDLFTALKENRLYGAGLDVWWTYPPKFVKYLQFKISCESLGMNLKRPCNGNHQNLTLEVLIMW